MAFIDRWLLFRGIFVLYKLEMGPLSSGRYSEVVVGSGLTVYLYFTSKTGDNLFNVFVFSAANFVT